MGCLILSQLYTSTLERSAIPEHERVPFRVYVDEAFKFLPTGLADALVTSRKYNVGYCLAHQYTSQFDTEKNEALDGVGSTIIFRVTTKDARLLAQHLQGEYTAEDLVALKPYEAIAKIGNDVVKFKTYGPSEIQDSGNWEILKKQSYEKYYKPVSEVKKVIASIYGNEFDFGTVFQENHKKRVKEFEYDEF